MPSVRLAIVREQPGRQQFVRVDSEASLVLRGLFRTGKDSGECESASVDSTTRRIMDDYDHVFRLVDSGEIVPDLWAQVGVSFAAAVQGQFNVAET